MFIHCPDRIIIARHAVFFSLLIASGISVEFLCRSLMVLVHWNFNFALDVIRVCKQVWSWWSKSFWIASNCCFEGEKKKGLVNYSRNSRPRILRKRRRLPAAHAISTSGSQEVGSLFPLTCCILKATKDQYLLVMTSLSVQWNRQTFLVCSSWLIGCIRLSSLS